MSQGKVKACRKPAEAGLKDWLRSTMEVGEGGWVGGIIGKSVFLLGYDTLMIVLMMKGQGGKHRFKVPIN